MNAPGDRLVLSLDTYSPTTLAPVDADSLPTATAYRVQAADGVTVAGPTLTVSKRSATTGQYEVKGVIPVNAAAGDTILVVASAVLSGTAYPATIGRMVVEAAPTTPPTTAEIADKLLGRSLAGSADGGRTVRDALRRLRNKVAAVGTTETVYQEDDVTEAWHGTLTPDATAVPATAFDPA